VARIHQLEQAAAFQVGAHDAGQRLRNQAVTGEVGDGDRNAVGTGAGDFDGELGMGARCCQQQRCRHQSEYLEHHILSESVGGAPLIAPAA
jgi:hypothetical protein